MWIQLKIETAEAQAAALAETLSEAGAVSVTMVDAADQPLFEPPPGATPLWRRTQVIGLFDEQADVDAVLAQVHGMLGVEPLAWEVEPVAEQDWERAWMDSFQPMRFGNRLWICPSWCAPPDPDAVNLMLDPGLAFGTGTHPTTALCLEWLDAHPPLHRDVIDYGCGSGVLAIAALKLGARHAIAVDNDPQALLATRDNAVKCDVAPQLSTCLPEDLPEARTDVLLANILANPLISLAQRFAALVRPGGQLVLSGILHDQAQEVLSAYTGYFDMAPPTVREDWVRLEGVRK